MLPPQLRQSAHRSLVSPSAGLVLRAATSSLLRASVAHAQSRSFWGWRKPSDWASTIDPMYHRFHRIRTLKTRAKLLEKMRRRGKFDWDASQKPFFSSRHIRWASHWNYDRDRRQWFLNDGPSEQNAKSSEDGAKAEEGYELSRREKVWKEQMEAMRKRIAQDPYEAIFGKRFEPFWSPLVPSWMREEMGLQGWPKQKETTNPKPARAEPTEPAAKDHKKPEVTGLDKRGAPEHARRGTEQPSVPRNGSYSYSSSTSWDSLTRKTRRVEWDSVSNQTKRYEYDPISNRMVQVEAPKAAESTELKNLGANPAPAGQHGSAVSESKVVGIPSKQSSELRKSIPIPPPLSQPSHNYALGYASQTSIGPARSTSVSMSPPKPSALAKLPATDLDMLTADDVRASMGKMKQPSTTIKQTSPEEKAKLERDFVEKTNTYERQIDAILKERDLAKKKMSGGNEWDQAEAAYLLDRELENLRKKKEKLLKDERGLFHIEKQKRELHKLDDRIQEVAAQVDSLQVGRSKAGPSTMDLAAQRAELLEGKKQMLSTSLQQAETAQATADNAPALQSSVERMQSKELPMVIDADDSAAHESTEPLDSIKSVPKEWPQQADMLQADRVRRTAGKRPYPVTRWIDDMQARKDAYDARKAEENAVDNEHKTRLAKAKAMLEAEVQEQRLRMQAHEGRYAHKITSMRQELETAYNQSSLHAEKHLERIRDLEMKLESAKKAVGDNKGLQASEKRYADKVRALRQELNTAFKQSTVHSEEHLDRIRALEKELEKAQKAAAESEGLRAREKRYTDKIRALREELDISFKQSTIHSEKHLERIRYLEKELERLQKPSGEANAAQDHVRAAALKSAQAEGDFCPNITKFADSGKWYKQAASPPTQTRPELAKAEQKAKDQALVKEVREIYENAYGTINTNHHQSQLQSRSDKKTVPAKKPKQVVEVESDVDLGDELAKYEKEQPYRFQADELENEIASQEIEAHEAQRLMQPESSGKMKEVIATELAKKNEQANNVTKSGTVEPTVLWEEPPVYKVIAYDSGNDKFSTATTTANLTDSETPISIPKALSQLYQPARFVPFFAELQKDGYQVIYGTKDLLVFKKVKRIEPATVIQPTLQDHGLIGARAPSGERIVTPVNPIDGTRIPHSEPPTGNYASPTGFVNHDPVFPSEQAARETRTPAAPSNSNTGRHVPSEAELDDIDWRHYPRVRREEAVFTGTHRKWNSAHRRHGRAEERERRFKRRRKGKTMKRVLFAGLGAAGVMYLIGAAAEKSRAGRDEDWARKAEEQRRRWREGQ